MLTISLIHTNWFVDKNTPNKIGAHKCMLSSEKRGQILANKRRIQLFRNGQRGWGLLQGIFTSWHTEHPQLCKSHLRCKKPWKRSVPWISHGPCASTSGNEQLPGMPGTLSRASTAGRVTGCHRQCHTIPRAHLVLQNVKEEIHLFGQTQQNNTVASTSSFCSFQKFPFSVLPAFSPLCPILSKP